MNKLEEKKFIYRFKSLFSKKLNNFFLHEPTFTNEDKLKILQCVDSGWVSTSGKMVEDFENKIKEE